MVTVQGEIQAVNVIPADPEADPPTVEMVAATIQLQEPSTGVINIIVPTGATGGLALGSVRVIIAEA
jgi:hypothetical protein